MTDEKIIDDIEKSEGWPKYTNHPNDLGGPTKGGITLNTLRAWRNNPNTSIADLMALSREEARAIYQFMFVQPFALITDGSLKHYLVDLGVLRGPRKAAIMLQMIVGARPFDGWIGPVTLKAMKPFTPRDLKVMLIGSRFTHIETRVLENETQEWARNGWRNRNGKFLKG
jgi:lysozyme family protein